ncbi:MAG: glycosyltransferase [Candidatus Woesearchaeota archaeon]
MDTVVVTPTYCTHENQRQDKLYQTILTVKAQTEPAYHVVVDDGSTDDTFSWLEKLAERNDHLRVYRKENGGSSSAINLGIEKAIQLDPAYITVCHSDDLLTSYSIEMRKRLMQEKDVSFSYTDMLILYEEQDLLRRKSASPLGENLFENLLQHKTIPFPTMFWKTELLQHVGGFDENLTSAEDWDIAIRSAKTLSEKGLNHAVSSNISTIYRVHDKNLAYQNLRDGTRWRAYKRILGKHLSGTAYQTALMKEACGLSVRMLPTPIMKYLRLMRDTFESWQFQYSPRT